MASRLYYLTFRRLLNTPQVTVFTDAAPIAFYRELKASGAFVCYGREGEAPARDSRPDVAWDMDAGNGQPSGARK